MLSSFVIFIMVLAAFFSFSTFSWNISLYSMVCPHLSLIAGHIWRMCSWVSVSFLQNLHMRSFLHPFLKLATLMLLSLLWLSILSSSIFPYIMVSCLLWCQFWGLSNVLSLFFPRINFLLGPWIWSLFLHGGAFLGLFWLVQSFGLSRWILQLFCWFLFSTRYFLGMLRLWWGPHPLGCLFLWRGGLFFFIVSSMG